MDKKCYRFMKNQDIYLKFSTFYLPILPNREYLQNCYNLQQDQYKCKQNKWTMEINSFNLRHFGCAENIICGNS